MTDSLTPTNILSLAPETFPKIALFANLVLNDIKCDKVEREDILRYIDGYEQAFATIKEAIK
jgi:hypothetical protein